MDMTEMTFEQLKAIITDNDLYCNSWHDGVDYESTDISIKNVMDTINKSGFKIIKMYDIISIQNGVNSIKIDTGEQYTIDNLVEALLEYFPVNGLSRSSEKFKLPKDTIMQIINSEYPHMFQKCDCREGKPMFCMQSCCGEYGIKLEYQNLLI